MSYNMSVIDRNPAAPELSLMYLDFNNTESTIEAAHYLFGTDRDEIGRTRPSYTQDQIQAALHSQVFFDNQIKNLKWQIVQLARHLDEDGNYIFSDGYTREGYNLDMTPERWAFLQQDENTIQHAIATHVHQNPDTGELDCDDAVLAELIKDLISYGSPFYDEAGVFDSDTAMTAFHLLSIFNQILAMRAKGEKFDIDFG